MEATPILIPATSVEVSTTLPMHYLQLRRGAELMAVVAAAPVWLPAIGLIAAVSWIAERKQVLFIQNRPGKNGELFRLYKFRTMYLRCDDRMLTAQHDKRITKVGRFLRRHKLDELPQLFNVLKGDMSLVGPRPVPENFYYQYLQEIPQYDQRHVIKPGITGLAQVRLGYTETVEQEKMKLHYDLQYINHIGPRQDLRILGQTFRLLGRKQKQ